MKYNCEVINLARKDNGKKLYLRNLTVPPAGATRMYCSYTV